MVNTRKQKKHMESTTTKNTLGQNLTYYLKKAMFSPFGGFTAVVFATAFIHWLLINLYVIFCAPPSLFGLLSTMLALGSPVCHFINITQVELARHFITIWGAAAVAVIAWLASKLSWKEI